MSNCLLDENARCRVCGRQASGIGVKRNCRASVLQHPPGSFAKAVNFATSAAKHVAAGMPQATQEQIDARFAICQGCPHFDGKACRLCGCPVVREQAYISKLSWANEKCPAGKWGPVQVES